MFSRLNQSGVSSELRGGAVGARVPCLVLLLLVLLLLSLGDWESTAFRLVESLLSEGNETVDDVEEEVLLGPVREDGFDFRDDGLGQTSVSTLSHGTTNSSSDDAGNFSGNANSLSLGHVTVEDEDEVGELGDAAGEIVLELLEAGHGESLGRDEWNVAWIRLTLVGEGKGNLLSNFLWVEGTGAWSTTLGCLTLWIDGEEESSLEEWAGNLSGGLNDPSSLWKRLEDVLGKLDNGSGDGLGRGVLGKDVSDLVGNLVSDLGGILVTLLFSPDEGLEGGVDDVEDDGLDSGLDLGNALVASSSVLLVRVLLVLLLVLPLGLVSVVLLVGEHTGLVWEVGSVGQAELLFVSNLFPGLGLDLAFSLITGVDGLEGIAGNDEGA